MPVPRQVAFQIGALSNLIRRMVPREVKDKSMEGLTMRQRWILGFVGRRVPADVYQKDIESEMNIRRSTASVLLRQLEESGFITRQAVEHDARLKKILLTPIAQQRLSLAIEGMRQIDGLLTENISQSELDAFYAVTDKMKDNLERAIAGRTDNDPNT